MIIVAQSRQLQIRDVLAHPLGPLPWVLAKGDGSLRKTNKAALARELKKSVTSRGHSTTISMHHRWNGYDPEAEK